MKQDYWEQIILEAARRDTEYQALLRKCRAAEEDYRAILAALSPAQAEQLETYIALCEELQHRLTVLACEIPREEPT